MSRVIILGAGVTGLTAGLASGRPVFEAEQAPGGICSSYYMRAGNHQRLPNRPPDGAYRFEIGGGHWIFGGDPTVLRLIRHLVTVKSYVRKSAAYLPDRDLFVPYPIQYNLRHLGKALSAKALEEIGEETAHPKPSITMAEWLHHTFGATLCHLFFDPFHDLYTAGLWRTVAAQDAYKSPIDLDLVRQGTLDDAPPIGYNATFVYPVEGLNTLAQRLAKQSDITYGMPAMGIDLQHKVVHFPDGRSERYDLLVSTLPLNTMMAMTGLRVDEPPDPATSVLVFNIGGIRGRRCPDLHWVYVPASTAGFHRVGFYSNVDPSFLSAADRDRVAIYVEMAFRGGQRPEASAISNLGQRIVDELRGWQWIEDAEVVDPTWIEVAYTWSRPGSRWRSKALRALEAQDVLQVGRFARWTFQGIAESMRDGLAAGAALRDV